MTWHVNKRELYGLFGALWFVWFVVLGNVYIIYAVSDSNPVTVGLAVISGFLAAMATVAVAERCRVLRLYSNKGKGRDPRKRPRAAEGARS